MTAGEIIAAYQEANEPPLTDVDLARLWGVSKSCVGKIKRGIRRPGNKVWPNCQKNTPVLYTFLQSFYYGEASPPEPPQTTQDGSGGVLAKLLRVFNLRS